MKLTATAAKGSKFAGWTGACSGAASSCTVSMNAAITVGARFDRVPYPLSYSKTGTGTGKVTILNTGTVCTSVCSTSFLSGTVVRLTATPDAASSFAGWTGGCSGSGTCVVTLNDATQVSGRFNKVKSTLTTKVQGATGGRITATGVNCTSQCQTLIANTSKVSLKATPAAGWRLQKWTGACSGTGTCSLKMSSDKKVGAIFVRL